MLDSKKGLLPFRHGIHLIDDVSQTSEEMVDMALPMLLVCLAGFNPIQVWNIG